MFIRFEIYSTKNVKSNDLKRQGCRYVHHNEQWCTNFQKNLYSVHFVCTLYGRKMLADLLKKHICFFCACTPLKSQVQE